MLFPVSLTFIAAIAMVYVAVSAARQAIVPKNNTVVADLKATTLATLDPSSIPLLPSRRPIFAKITHHRPTFSLLLFFSHPSLLFKKELSRLYSKQLFSVSRRRFRHFFHANSTKFRHFLRYIFNIARFIPFTTPGLRGQIWAVRFQQ